MNRPKFVPIGYCKGWSKEKNEWIYGWHWSHLMQAGKDSHITHYIRIQKDYNFGLSYHKDYEVTNCGYYMNIVDCHGVPLFLGDKVLCIYKDKKIIGKMRLAILGLCNNTVIETKEGKILNVEEVEDIEYMEELQNE